MHDLYATQGPDILLEKILGNIFYYPSVILFVFFNEIREADENTILLRLRQSTVDADRLSLIKSFSEENDDIKIYLAVWSKTIYEENSSVYQDIIDNYDVEIVSVHSLRFVIALAESSIVNFCHETDFLWHRRFDSCKERTYLRTYHGIVVKRNVTKKLHNQLPILPRPRVDLRPVSSDLELYARAALEKRDVKEFDKGGYPRFDRIYELKQGISEPALSKKSRKVLESSSKFKVLYAPTQGTKKKIHSLPGFDLEQLEEFLVKNDIELYIRMHTNEEKNISDKLIEKENIRHAGRSFSAASIEILPYMDTLITDYSSIYMEYLPFDKPLIFIPDEYLINKIGIRYNYDRYYPGKKVTSFDQLITHLETCSKNGDSYSDERNFVRKSFNIDDYFDFMDLIQSSSSNFPSNSER